MTNEAELSMPNEVLLVERLYSIPVDAHLSVHTPNPLGHDTRHWAVGALCHDAAARLAGLAAELEAARANAKRMQEALEIIAITPDAWAISHSVALAALDAARKERT